MVGAIGGNIVDAIGETIVYAICGNRKFMLYEEIDRLCYRRNSPYYRRKQIVYVIGGNSPCYRRKHIAYAIGGNSLCYRGETDSLCYRGNRWSTLRCKGKHSARADREAFHSPFLNHFSSVTTSAIQGFFVGR